MTAFQGYLSRFDFPPSPLLCGAVIGTILNASGILVGGTLGLVRRKGFRPATEAFFKVMLGVFTVYYGLRLTWLSLNGSGLQIAKQLLIVLLSMILGKLCGRWLQLQKLSNQVGRAAGERIKASSTNPGSQQNPGEGFKTCAALFCAAPLGIIGAVTDGLSDYYSPLAIKGIMDGLATFGFVRLFGWGALLSVVPVVALQGTITLACHQWLLPLLQAHSSENHELVNSLNGVAGLMIFSVALVILELKRLELTDYVPALVFAPCVAWLFH